MIEVYERLLDCKNHLRNNLNVFIEAFVEFYGEEYRKEIEEKFSKAIFFAYREPSTTETYLRRISELISEEIMHNKVKELDFKDITYEDLTLRNSFNLEKSMPIYDFKEFLRLYEMGPEEREKEYIEESYKNISKYIPDLTREEFEVIVRTKKIPEKYNNLNKLIRKELENYMDLSKVDEPLERYFKNSLDLIKRIDSNITINTFSYYLDNEEMMKLCELAHTFDELKENYTGRMQKYDKYQEEAKQNEILRSSLRKKYLLLFIEDNLDLLTEDEIKTFEEVKKGSNKDYLLTGRIRKLFGYGVESNHAYDSFSEEAEEKLIDPETNTWKRNQIKKERIEYFRMCGIDHHKEADSIDEEYEILLRDNEARQLWPKKERVKRFIESRNRLLNEYNIEYYENQPAFIEMRKEADELDVLDKNDPIDATLYTGSQTKTMVCPNVVKTKDGYDIFSFIMINCNNNDGTIDHNIVHELNHQFELFLRSVDGNRYHGICGWDVLDGEISQVANQDIDTLAPEGERRNYEMMNEIVNELIAQDICEILHKKGQYVFDTEENVRTKHTTCYESAFYIIKDFYNEFKKEILESRKNGNIEVIWNKVGKENFDALNELFHEHFEHFGGFRYLALIEDIKNKKDTPKTRKFYDIVERKNKIMDQMRRYSMAHEEIEILDEDVKEK